MLRLPRTSNSDADGYPTVCTFPGHYRTLRKALRTLGRTIPLYPIKHTLRTGHGPNVPVRCFYLFRILGRKHRPPGFIHKQHHLLSNILTQTQPYRAKYLANSHSWSNRTGTLFAIRGVVQWSSLAFPKANGLHTCRNSSNSSPIPPCPAFRAESTTHLRQARGTRPCTLE
jgi:hypothetical protein